MEKVKLQKAKDDLKKIFENKGAKFKTYDVDRDVKENNSSFIIDNTFMIDKRHIEREDVIALLVDYFQDKCVEDGCCSIGPITLCWTDVTLYDKDNPEKKMKKILAD